MGEHFPAGLELLRLHADADAEPEASAGEDVDFRRLLGDQRGAAHGKHEHSGDEIDLLCHRGQIAEQDEDLVEHVRGVVDIFPVRPALLVEADDLVEGGEVVVAEFIRGLPEIPDSDRIEPDFELWEQRPNLHLESPLASFRP